MSRTERSLQVLRTQAQLDVVRVAAEAARSAARRAEAQHRVVELTRRCQSSAQELRGAMGRDPIDPGVVQAVRLVHVTLLQAQRRAEAQLVVTREAEGHARQALAAERHRERSLARALRAEAGIRRQHQHDRDARAADDMFLQRTWMEAMWQT